jgi:hypothetical protein
MNRRKGEEGEALAGVDPDDRSDFVAEALMGFRL